MLPPASALRSLLRAARSLPPPVRSKLLANVRDVADLGLGTKPADAAAAARLVRWVEGLSKVSKKRVRGTHARVHCVRACVREWDTHPDRAYRGRQRPRCQKERERRSRRHLCARRRASFLSSCAPPGCESSASYDPASVCRRALNLSAEQARHVRPRTGAARRRGAPSSICSPSVRARRPDLPLAPLGVPPRLPRTARPPPLSPTPLLAQHSRSAIFKNFE